MNWFASITVGDVISATVLCALTYECLVLALPDDIAGPGGWLIDTGDAE